jgi:hypothetical protein
MLQKSNDAKVIKGSDIEIITEERRKLEALIEDIKMRAIIFISSIFISGVANI